jgi:hypothetical protein
MRLYLVIFEDFRGYGISLAALIQLSEVGWRGESSGDKTSRTE